MHVRFVALLGLLGFATGAALTSQASAQVITAAVRGTVTSADDGLPIADAEVVLVHVPSGNEKTALSNDSGSFAFTGLRIGGPYRVTVQSLGFAPFDQKDIFLTAGKTREIAVGLRLTEEVINIVGTSTPRNASARTVVSAEAIGELPSIGRDPKDVVRLTPGAYTEGANKSLSIDGNNNRFNSVTVDGTRQDDDFGLNASGYPTRRSPVALSAVEEVAVESSPFDVRYGTFLGGNINIVTKTGSNDFHGQVLGTYTGTTGGDFYGGNLLLGDRTRDNKFRANFDEFRFGGTVGGPIVKDKVHFLASVEALRSTSPVDVGPLGSGTTIIVSRVTQSELDNVQRIARDVYGFEPGTPGRSLDEADLKILGKVDWAINAQHRLSVSYQRTKGNVINPTNNSDTTLPLSSNWYDANDTLDTGVIRLFSDWSDQLSTEFEASGKMVANRQKPLNGNEFASINVRTAAGGFILLGPDEFRHANRLDNDLFHLKGQANYLLSNHLLTGGLEYDQLMIDNLFVAGSRGVANYNSVTDFENKIPNSLRYNNAISGDPKDAVADWRSGTVAGYLQDQFEATPDLTLQGGLRVEAYRGSKDITENPRFRERYGFGNTETLSGRYSLLPRFGASYRALPRVNVRGGFGLYGGGTPNVWVSNSYTNDGVRVDTDTATAARDSAIINGFDGRTIPQALRERLVAGDGNVDAIDPDFKIPTSWKFSTGIDTSFDLPGLGEQGQGVELKLNYTFTKVRDAVRWRELRRDLASLPNNLPVGVLPDGRPLYDTEGTAATELFNTTRGYDMLLTNTDKGHGHAASLAIQKQFSFGLTLAGTYAFTRVQEVSPANSTRSVTNYSQAAVIDPENPGLATSNYEREHRITGIVQFSRALIKDIWPCCERPWKDMRTTISLFIESRSGQPFSYTFADSTRGDTLSRIFGEEREFASRNRQLFYVPKGDGSDVVLMGIDQADFDAFLKQRGLDKYRGQIAPRNAFRSSWINRFDMRISQDLPSPVVGNRARFVFDIENVGNLLNNNWGRSSQVTFPFLAPAVDVSVVANPEVPGTVKYVYSNLRTLQPQRVDVLASVWRMSVGIIYDF
jgi:Carboxypeptidase regulatory-like domain/TonB dependent receptor/TonB-dependent Receptor Plug Domain